MVTGKLPDAIEALRLIYTDLIKEHRTPLAPSGTGPPSRPREPVSEENPCLQVSSAELVPEALCQAGPNIFIYMTQHSHMLCQHVIHALTAFMTQQVQHRLLKRHSVWHNFSESESFPAGESHHAQHGLQLRAHQTIKTL